MKKMKEPLVAHEKGKEKERTLLAKEGDREDYTTKPQPASTIVKRQHSSLQAKLVKVTRSQGKEIVTNMEKLG